MIRVNITTDAANTRAFLVRVEGQLQHPRDLNDALGRRLVRELHQHFLDRNAEPNKMGAPKTNYWSGLIESTQLAEVSDTGAVVAIADVRFRIQLFGGTIKPTGGRKFLTIPLVNEARGLRVADYEKQSGRKVFRLRGRMVLMERSDQADQSLVGAGRGTIRTRGGDFREVNLRARSSLRAVFALKTSVTIHKDPRALPPQDALIAALNQTAAEYVARLTQATAATS